MGMLNLSVLLMVSMEILSTGDDDLTTNISIHGFFRPYGFGSWGYGSHGYGLHSITLHGAHPYGAFYPSG